MKMINRIHLSIKYRINRFKYIIVSSYNQLLSKIVKAPRVVNTNKTIDKIIEEKCSVSRYGEGEFKLMRGKDLLFQETSEELRNRLNEIIYNINNRHIVCIPNVFENIDRFTEKAYEFWYTYLNTDRHYIYKILDMEREYYDALMTRVYIDYKDKSESKNLFESIKKIWEYRDITIVEGEKSRLGLGNNLFDNVKSLNRILCPSENAFSKYNEILNEVKKEDNDRLILIALGPTATVLAYDLSQNGYQAIDIGHVDIEYEWFLQQVKQKCTIKNKYVGEVVDGTDVDIIDNEIYRNQIIYRVL